MAMNPKIPGKRQSNGTTPAPAKAPQVSVAPEPDFAHKIAAPPAAVGAAFETALIVAPRSQKASPEFSASPEPFDAKAWPLKSLQFFSENAAAIFDYASALGNVGSIKGAFELQSRFVCERYSTLTRQTKEMTELTRRFAVDSTASLRRSFTGWSA